MQRVFTLPFFFDGTLAANKVINFILPCDAQLVHASLCATTAAAGTLKVGKSDDDDAYMAAKNFGASGVPAEYDWNDFINSQYPHIPKGTNIMLTVTHNSMINPHMVLTFTEG